jgi:hypothetical protein
VVVACGKKQDQRQCEYDAIGMDHG